MTDAHLDPHKVFQRFGGPSGLQAKLVTSRYCGEKSLSASTVRVWKTRNSIPGRFVLPIILIAQDNGWDFRELLGGLDVTGFDPFAGMERE